MILFDTHAILWYALKPDLLSRDFSRHLKANDKIAISSISAWEIALKEQKGKLFLGMKIEAFFHSLRAAGIEIINPTIEVWIKSVKLPWKNPDPADRVIVATAMINHFSLLSKDREIKKFYAKTVW